MGSQQYFKQQLEIGKTGETAISKFLISRGSSILPIYEIAENQFKGPGLYHENGDTVAPDMLCITNGKTVFIEAKHKAGATFFRKTQQFQTGIDLRHWEEYQKIKEITNIDVWILFLHRGEAVKDSEAFSGGLYGNNITKLLETIDHISDRHAKGMVYWNMGSLRKIATYEEVTSLS